MRVTQVTGVKDDAHLRRRAPVLWPWVLVVAAWMIGGEVPWRRTGYLPCRLILLLSILTKRTVLRRLNLSSFAAFRTPHLQPQEEPELRHLFLKLTAH